MKKTMNWIAVLSIFLFSFALSPKNVDAFPGTFSSKQNATPKSGTLSGDETWSGEILITGDVTIPDGITLTILPGTTVRFQALQDDQSSGAYLDKSEIIIVGRLLAQGTAGSPITFTSSSSSAAPGDWGRIYTSQGDGSPTNPDTIFEFSVIEYGSLGVVYQHRPPYVTNSIFRFNAARGLWHDSCTACTNGIIQNNEFYQNATALVLCCSAHDQVSGNHIHDNYAGIQVFYYAAPIISCNFIHDNQRGIYVQGHGYLTYPEIHDSSIVDNALHDLANEEQTDISATGNYWGTTDPAVIAQHIIDHEDNATYGTVDFSNFRETPPACTPSTNQPPTVDAGGPYLVNEGSSVSVAATGNDPDLGDTLTYAWDLDNNGSFETPGQSVGIDASALDGPSNYIINVQATDTGSLSATDSATVNVQNVAPTATLSNDGPVLAGSSVTVSFSAQFDPSSSDISAGFHYAFACDGSSLATATYGNSGTVASTNCTFSDSPSLHTVLARIIDKDDGFSEYTTVVTVNSARTFYLHGTGPAGKNNPPALFLNNNAPTDMTAKSKDSASIKFSGGNLWKDVGSWAATPALSQGTLLEMSNFHAWLGLKNNDDQGTNFDLRVEVYKNGTLVASGESYCITDVTQNPSQAKEVILSFSSFPSTTYNGTTDTLSLKILTRIGTNGSGVFCGGHSNATGLRLYFDAVSRNSRFDALFGP